MSRYRWTVASPPSSQPFLLSRMSCLARATPFIAPGVRISLLRRKRLWFSGSWREGPLTSRAMRTSSAPAMALECSEESFRTSLHRCPWSVSQGSAPASSMAIPRSGSVVGKLESLRMALARGGLTASLTGR